MLCLCSPSVHLSLCLSAHSFPLPLSLSNQADHYGVVTGTLGEFEYIGQVPGDETTYGVVQRMKLGYLMASFFSTDGPSTPVLKAMKLSYDALVGTSKENPVDVGTQVLKSCN